jgi:dTDP-4-dehydrorhamnose 3,5-epimerase
MHVTPTELPEVLVIEPAVFKDDRGFFFETYQAKKWAEFGIPAPMVQDNQSGSRQGVLRGLHYQLPQAQGKLVRVLSGEIFDVAVDIRRSSPRFGKWVGVRLSAENRKQLWVPVGFAHGFYVMSQWADVTYKVTEYWAPKCERTILWNDPAIGITWPLAGGTAPLVSPKDGQGLPLAKAEVFA